MSLGKEKAQEKYILEYRHWQEVSNKYFGSNPFACLARDNMRRIENIFEKTFHESINKFMEKVKND